MSIKKILIFIILVISISKAEGVNSTKKPIIYSQVEIISVDWFNSYQYKIESDYVKKLHENLPDIEYNYFLVRQQVKVMLLSDIIHGLDCKKVDDAEAEVDGRLIMNLFDGDNIVETYFANRTEIANLTTNEVCMIDESFWEQFEFLFKLITREQVFKYRELSKENDQQP